MQKPLKAFVGGQAYNKYYLTSMNTTSRTSAFSCERECPVMRRASRDRGLEVDAHVQLHGHVVAVLHAGLGAEDVRLADGLATGGGLTPRATRQHADPPRRSHAFALRLPRILQHASMRKSIALICVGRCC